MTLETATTLGPHELPWKDVMENLQGHVGKYVSIHYASDGSQGIIRGVLIEVIPFQDVRVGNSVIPFMNRRAAIQRIMADETLYRLSIISDQYGGRRLSGNEVKSLRKFVFRGEDREAEETLAI